MHGGAGKEKEAAFMQRCQHVRKAEAITGSAAGCARMPNALHVAVQGGEVAPWVPSLGGWKRESGGGGKPIAGPLAPTATVWLIHPQGK